EVTYPTLDENIAPIIGSSIFVSAKHTNQVSPFSIFGEDVIKSDNPGGFVSSYCAFPFHAGLPSHIEVCLVHDIDCFKVPTLNLEFELSSLLKPISALSDFDGISIVHNTHPNYRPYPSFLLNVFK